MHRVWVLSGPMHRREWPHAIEVERLSYLVVHGTAALLVDPSTPRLFVVGRDRHGVEVADHEGLRRVIVVVSPDLDHEAESPVLVLEKEGPVGKRLRLRDDLAEDV